MNKMLADFFSNPLNTDLLILLLFIFSGFVQLAFTVYLLYTPRGWRQVAIAVLFAIIIFNCQLLLAYSAFIEPYWLDKNQVEVSISKSGIENETQRKMNIVLISDLHLGRYKNDNYLENLVREINAEKPDIVVIPGDFVLDRKENIRLAEPLSQLNTRYGVYATLGNHDYDLKYLGGLDFEQAETSEFEDYIANELESFGVRVLRNEGFFIEGLYLAGMEDYWGNRGYFSEAFAALDNQNSQHPTVLLAHSPDFVDLEVANRADLVLSGHTHAGQVNLPIIGNIMPIPTYAGDKYVSGLYTEGEQKLYVTRGVGEVGARTRLLARPEITVIQLEY
ncbi:MAG: metallophosphoesterase [Candidatus Dojkabacteria bacterium]